jgi:hypothetical protein
LQIAFVADHEAPGRIEHVETLRHVVQRRVELVLLLVKLLLGLSPLRDVLVSGDPSAT